MNDKHLNKLPIDLPDMPDGKLTEDNMRDVFDKIIEHLSKSNIQMAEEAMKNNAPNSEEYLGAEFYVKVYTPFIDWMETKMKAMFDPDKQGENVANFNFLLSKVMITQLGRAMGTFAAFIAKEDNGACDELIHKMVDAMHGQMHIGADGFLDSRKMMDKGSTGNPNNSKPKDIWG